MPSRITFLALGSEQLPLSLLAPIARRHGHHVGLAFSPGLFADRFYLDVPALAERLDDRAQVLAEIERQRPDVLACSVLTNTYQWMLGVARDARLMLPGLKVVFGGVHPSAVPDRVLAREEVDAIVVGEGDLAFPALLAAFEEGGLERPIPNVRVKTPAGIVAGPHAPYVQDLDALPAFDKTLWEDHVRVADVYLTMASRGCPYRCTFCFNSFFAELPEGPRGKYVRQRGVDHMMRELTEAKRRYGRLHSVNFQDDIFTVDKAWLRPFLERYRREIDAPFRCLSHPRYVDEEVARWLAEAGCAWVQIGVQSVDDEFKQGTLKRYERADHVDRALEALARHRVLVQTDHILGLPGEPPGAQEQARELYLRHRPARISVYWATYFPGSVMVQQGLDLGLITPEDVQRFSDGDLQTYHNALRAAGSDPQRLRSLRAYDAIFRLAAVLPGWLLTLLTARRLERLPQFVLQALGYCGDLLAGLRSKRYEERAYLRHYAHHLARLARRKLGLSPSVATVALRPAVQLG